MPIGKFFELLRYIEELQEDVKYYRRKAEEGSR